MADLGVALTDAPPGACLVDVDVDEGRFVAVALGASLDAPIPTSMLEALRPEERELAETLPLRRRWTWVGGRLALHQAVRARSGERPPPVLATPRGAPSLPRGWTGSIAHKDAVAVALASSAPGHDVGVDVELGRPLSTRLTSKILRPDEADELFGDAPDDDARGHALLLAFSAKEAIYKAIDPHLRRWVGFHEVRLRGRPERYEVEPLFGDAALHVEARALRAGDVVVAFARAWRR